MAGISGIGDSPGIHPRYAPSPGRFPILGPARQPDSHASKSGEAPGSAPLDELTEEEGEVRELKQRDAEVRRHEQAHLAAAGQYARGGANFTYERGPDGRLYATGGEVPIDVGEERTPEATIRKARIVRRAALAPANPSPQDRGIAAQAERLETRARRELAGQKQTVEDVPVPPQTLDVSV